MSYLKAVVTETISADDIDTESVYKLNEAVFNLKEREIDEKLAPQIFRAVQRVHKAYQDRTEEDTSDPNFFYEYLSMLSTMQYQSFFSKQQVSQLQSWIGKAADTQLRSVGSPEAGAATP